MPTTTNYGWTTPADTDLVKDGASAIRTLGTAIDTTTKNLNPSTTVGDIEYRSSTTNVNTRLALGTAGQVLKVNSGATAPEWGVDPTNDLITTAGDLVYGTAADTMTRLGIGTAGQVLTVNSGATAPEWTTLAAGGQTLLSTTSLSGSTTTVSGISGSYKHLYIFVENAYQATSNSACTYTLNGSSALLQWRMTMSNTTLTAGSTYEPAAFDLGTLYASSGKALAAEIYIPRYSETSTRKEHFVRAMSSDGSTWKSIWANNSIDGTGAITSFTISAGANFSAGTIYIYGVN